MRDVKVDRDELLTVVRENREKHRAEYKEAVEGYKQAAVADIQAKTAKLMKMVEDLEDGELVQIGTLHFTLPIPVDHTKDYDQVIRMLEMSVDDELTIRSDEFACYVMDDWDWKEAFVNTSAIYKGR